MPSDDLTLTELEKLILGGVNEGHGWELEWDSNLDRQNRAIDGEAWKAPAFVYQVYQRVLDTFSPIRRPMAENMLCGFLPRHTENMES